MMSKNLKRNNLKNLIVITNFILAIFIIINAYGSDDDIDLMMKNWESNPIIDL